MTAVSAQPGLRPAVAEWARALVAGAVTGLLGAALLALILVGAFTVAGHRFLVVSSGSMVPSLSPGDVAVTRLVAPEAVVPGEVVSFKDPSRSGRVVTHRVVRVTRGSDEVSFVTKGDRNETAEEWTVARGGRVGRLTLVVPWVATPLARLGSTWVAASLVAVGVAVAGGFALTRIWRR